MAIETKTLEVPQFDLPDMVDPNISTVSYSRCEPQFHVTDLNYFSAGFEDEGLAWRFFRGARARGRGSDLIVLPATFKVPHNHDIATYPTDDGTLVFRHSDKSVRLIVTAQQLPLWGDEADE